MATNITEFDKVQTTTRTSKRITRISMKDIAIVAGWRIYNRERLEKDTKNTRIHRAYVMIVMEIPHRES